MFYLILCFLLLVLYWILPLPLQLIMFVINGFIPDPIPFLDEIVMIISFFKKLSLVANIFENILGVIFRLLSKIFWILVFLGIPIIIYSFFIAVKQCFFS